MVAGHAARFADAANLPSGVPSVARASCVPSRNLDRGTESQRAKNAPAHISLIVVPEAEELLQPPAPQKAALWAYLDERRTLTTRHHVVGPYYVPIGGEIVIARTSDTLSEKARSRVQPLVHGETRFLYRLKSPECRKRAGRSAGTSTPRS